MKFVQLVREWHSTCDTRGLRADVRVTLLYNMYCFLTQDIDFNRFPFPLTGRYWQGMPVQTYEALLQNICTRIQLYDIAHNDTTIIERYRLLQMKVSFLTWGGWIRRVALIQMLATFQRYSAE